MTTPKIKLEGVTKSFGDNHVLMGIDVQALDDLHNRGDGPIKMAVRAF